VYRQITWHVAPQQRIAAAALSVAFTAALVAVLKEAPLNEAKTSTHKVIVWLPPVIPAVRDPAVTFKPSGRTGRSANKENESAGTRSIQEPSSEHAESSESPATAIHLEGASAPLQLQLSNPDAHAAKSAIRSMAERSHTYMGDKRVSEQDRWSKSVESAGKADCLAPNEHGSLLSVFVLAFNAAREKCR
jgi:hypothetical protein